MGKLEGKVAVITGATSGIGFASAQRFAEEGATLFIAARRQAQLDTAVRTIGRRAVGVRCDISCNEDLDHLYAVVGAQVGAIDILFANAGSGEFRKLEDITDDHYYRIFDLNVKGTLFTVQKALPLLRDGASVILTGSTAATTGTAAFTVYGASKSAIRNFARNWILELAPRAIRVNVLVPGATLTEGWHGMAASDAQDQMMQRLAKENTPLARLAKPAEIAAAALFLASEESSYVNGSELYVDGGSTQK